MRAPDFWWSTRPTPGARLAMALLAPIAALYGAVTARRMRQPGAAAGLPVICIGNFVAGGAGKTPTALAVAQRLTALGQRPAFVSRGYGGRLSRMAGATCVDLSQHTALEAGDEPMLLAAQAPTFVARDRRAGAAAALAAGASVVVLDDGLQNPLLRKDVTLAVVDGAVGVGNGHVLPAGPLRAQLSAQWPHVDALVVIGAGTAGDLLAAEAQRLGKPVLRAELAPDAAVAASLRGQRVLAMAGIGRPAKFAATLADLGAEVADLAAFGDHHPFTVADVTPLLDRARRGGLRLVTTAKDAARMAGDPSLAALLDDITIVPVTLRFADLAALDAVLAAELTR